ncbi:hypothetical protein QE152_g29077 [Popillia japonica]|uniref:Reverse transcriptase domain-containing protein n=1 Tax=Popillia japonica TaxID=7064 RepID=A0AAW1JI74_POPJA
MAEQLENQFRFVTTAPENIRGDVMEEIVKIDHAAIRDPPEIELRELQDVIKVMSSRKAPGEDGINNRAIKLMGVNATEGLLKIVNAIFKWASPQHLEIGNNDINSKRRQGLGAAQQALNLMQDVKDKTGPRKVAVAALIDVEEAYDKVWRGGVQFKMKKLGIPVELIKITRRGGSL